MQKPMKQKYNSRRQYRTSVQGKILHPYECWSGIFDRCYDSVNKNPTYYDCEVHDDWIDYQDFCDWYYTQKYVESGWHIDKDILVKGNKIYSAEFCRFVPREINNLFTLRRRDRGDTPVGVCFHPRLNRYEARTSDGDGKLLYLGLYSSAEEAFLVSKEAKETRIKLIADKYKGRIDPEIYEALTNWQITMED